jgi:hypothetical protein
MAITLKNAMYEECELWLIRERKAAWKVNKNTD